MFHLSDILRHLEAYDFEAYIELCKTVKDLVVVDVYKERSIYVINDIAQLGEGLRETGLTNSLPKRILYPMIVAFSLLGSYAAERNVVHVILCLPSVCWAG